MFPQMNCMNFQYSVIVNLFYQIAVGDSAVAMFLLMRKTKYVTLVLQLVCTSTFVVPFLMAASLFYDRAVRNFF